MKSVFCEVEGVESASWVELCRMDIECSSEFWWEFFGKWVNFTLYNQIYKIQINHVQIDGESFDLHHHKNGFTLRQLEEMRGEANLPSKIEYWRSIFPRDYLKKKQVEDHVIHWIKENRCEFYPVVPDGNSGLLPHFYVQSRAYAFQLRGREECEGDGTKEFRGRTQAGTSTFVTFEVIPFKNPEHHMPERLKRVALFYFKTIEKWNKSFKNGGYKKRVMHDILVPLDSFTENYRILKEKYGYWAKNWPESTNPLKHVFEDLGIASFIISLWQINNEKPSFVDLGCGNGFLVYVLTMEGYVGIGIDIAPRKIWKLYPSNVSLLQRPIDTPNDSFDEDWIIANHPDELTPWIPYIASRTNKCFFVLPCCEWNFDKRFDKGKSSSRYLSYLEYVKHLTSISGYVPEIEHLRIPSTRNICIIGRKRTIDPFNQSDLCQIQINQLKCLEKAKFKSFVPRAKKHDKRKEY